ncbi:MAG: acyltransferase family protein [Acidobacteriaceae bacterium]|nr:acyltransferase family protein [Acidobacteriaceae bacterium]
MTAPNAPSSSAKPLSAAAQRSLLIDVVKGLAIILVAMGHTNQGLSREILIPWTVRVNAFIYAFHMPAFFFVSGIFVLSSLQKRGLRHFLVNRAKTLLWPFYVFAILISPWTPYLFRRWMHEGPPPLHDVLRNLVSANAEWFLPTLFFSLIIVALLRRVPAPLLFLLSWPLGVYWHQIGLAWVDRTVEFLPFLWLGVWVGSRYGVIERVPRGVAASLAMVLGGVIYVLTPNQLYLSNWRFVPVGIAGTLMLLLLARVIGSGALGRGLAWLGVASLGIYLMASYGQGFGRLLLHLVHVRAPLPHLLFDSAVAIAFGAWVYQHREKLRIGWIFICPF